MAGRCVLAVGNFLGKTPLAFQDGGGEWVLSRRSFSGKTQAQGGQVGETQFCRLGDMHKGVGALITIFFGIRRAADAEAVEDKKEGAAHLAMRSITEGV